MAEVMNKETADVEQHGKAQKSYEMVSTHEHTTHLDDGTSARISPDIIWSDLNYSVGDKKILTDCWGKVSLTLALFFVLFLSLVFAIVTRWNPTKYVPLWVHLVLERVLY